MASATEDGANKNDGEDADKEARCNNEGEARIFRGETVLGLPRADYGSRGTAVPRKDELGQQCEPLLHTLTRNDI